MTTTCLILILALRSACLRSLLPGDRADDTADTATMRRTTKLPHRRDVRRPAILRYEAETPGSRERTEPILEVGRGGFEPPTR